MLAVHADAINKQIVDPLTPSTPAWERLSAALDAVSQQKNSYLAGMYWYTDMGEAKAAAKKFGKPILSLRLLGKLSDEFSCANSRFFRTILYSNFTISEKLRKDFVLHWKSVRPVPHVTIDFGDGRKLERTLTGNSIHYILDVEGRISKPCRDFMDRTHSCARYWRLKKCLRNCVKPKTRIRARA